MAFQDLMAYLDNIGVADVLLPFILIFTLVFAVLQKTKILGDKAKNFNVIVALALGLGVVIPHVMGRYPEGADVVLIMNSALPNVSIVLVAILMLMLIVGIFGKNLTLGQNPISGWIVIVAILMIVYIFGRAAGWFGGPSWTGFLDNPETQTMVVVILVFAIIIWFVTKDTESDKDKEKDNIPANFAKLLGGGDKDK
jgi:hypothetical protein